MQEVMPDENWLDTNLLNTCDLPESALVECV